MTISDCKPVVSAMNELNKGSKSLPIVNKRQKGHRHCLSTGPHVLCPVSVAIEQALGSAFRELCRWRA